MAAPPIGAFELLGFGPHGWGGTLLAGAGVTVLVALCGLALGAVIGTCGAWAKIEGNRAARGAADVYTTIVRGVPDLLIIYLIYFGSSAVLTQLSGMLGGSGFVGIPSAIAGTLAVGIVSGALWTEVLRGAFRAVNTGELEAARACGMSTLLRLRRIVIPLTLRHALPGIGNVWLNAMKESSLLSVTGLAELMRQTQVAVGSTRMPFEFFLAAGAIYVLICTVSALILQVAERHYSLGVRGASR